MPVSGRSTSDVKFKGKYNIFIFADSNTSTKIQIFNIIYKIKSHVKLKQTVDV